MLRRCLVRTYPMMKSARAVGNGQLRLQQERGGDLTLFSPIAGLMSHHLGNERTSLEWAEVSNNLVRPRLRPVSGQLRTRLPVAAIAARTAEEFGS